MFKVNNKDTRTTPMAVQLPMNCLSVFDHFVGLALKGLRTLSNIYYELRAHNYFHKEFHHNAVDNYIFKVNNKNTRIMPMGRSGVFIVNFEHIPHLVLLVLLLTLSR